MSHATTNRDGRMNCHGNSGRMSHDAMTKGLVNQRGRMCRKASYRNDRRTHADGCAANDKRRAQYSDGYLAFLVVNEVVKFGDRRRHSPSGPWRGELPAD
jgi:hypothetical protein